MELHKYFDNPSQGAANATPVIPGTEPASVQVVNISFPEWPEAKLKMPFAQVPVLEVDGKMLAQSGAISESWVPLEL